MADDAPRFVKGPDMVAPLFKEAEDRLEKYYDGLTRDPEAGQITIGGDRYLLVRAESFSIELHDELSKTFGDAGAWQIAYKLGKALGSRDARKWHETIGVEDPFQKLALGPVNFALTGWASVHILPESRPQPDEDFFLVYEHPFSFEANAFIEAGQTSNAPTCVMNAGYSCGWCEVSFGIDLKAEEILCRGRGDDRCLFIMAHPKKFRELRENYLDQAGL